MKQYDAIIIGSGPNGLSAAIRLAQEGLGVLVIEGAETIGGGLRSDELTLPGFTHDICAAVHALGQASPFLRALPLEQYGLEWVQPEAPLAHPLDDGAIVMYRDIDATAAGLGADGGAYRRLMEPLVQDWAKLMDDFLGPLPLPPQHLVSMTRFGLSAIRSARGLVRARFQSARARALFGGHAGHAILPLERPATAGFGLMLALLAHAVGWPVARGGSQQVAKALAAHFTALGGKIETGHWVASLDELPRARAVFFDTAPRGLLKIAGEHLSPGYTRQLERYRYGPGVCKVDWALDGPIPWRDPEVAKGGTVHIGGGFEEIAAAERAVWQGLHPEKPFVLLVQPTLFDPGRAPEGKHTAWAYTHVPSGSKQDVSAVIETQIERFAPGFRDQILTRYVHTAAQMEAHNPNYVGGDINSGMQDLRQLFTRPAIRWNPYRVPVSENLSRGTGSSQKPRLYICSSATPPGGGVHGMSGFHAAETAIRDIFS